MPTSSVALCRMLSLADVVAMTTKAKATIYREIAKGTFPAPVRIGARRVAWHLSSIQSWMDDCVPTTDKK